MKCNMSKTRLISQSINDEIKKMLIHQFLLYSAKNLKRDNQIPNQDNSQISQPEIENCGLQPHF
ncbi:hypothetical protein EQ875_01536 [Photobacterium damselae subsp. damselae]|nr:hypothetical protein EQ875_01536 [Photobacterium damselae subsp. damselae]